MDRHRPQYHFLAPANWMNDPNGLIQWKGTYHLFYQHNPHFAFWGNIHWGHASSPDLVHWQHLPIALAPTPGGPDEAGVWSGCAVDWNAAPAVLYTGKMQDAETVCLATSDDSLVQWEKYTGNPVIAGHPPGLETLGFRDPCVWQVDGAWLMAIGSGFPGVGGAILLFSSADLTHWNYIGPMVTGDAGQRDPVSTGEMWECPNFFPLGDRYALVISPMEFNPSRNLYTLYMLGEFRDYRFTPEVMARMDGGDEYFYAPQTFLDEKNRRIVMGWSREARTVDASVEAGWAGVMTLPRLLDWRADGWMSQRPVPEVETLRGQVRTWRNLRLEPGRRQQDLLTLPGLSGDSLEIEMKIALPGIGGDLPGAFGLLVRRSPGGEEQTEIRIDRLSERLVVDTMRSSLSRDVFPRLFEIPLDLSGLDEVTLRIFLDRSIIEVFANDLAVITARVYPDRADSAGIALFSEQGPVTVEHLSAWEMQSIW